MNCKDCLHYKVCFRTNNQDTTLANRCDEFFNRSEWVHLPDDEYTFMVRGDIAKTLILANCRAADTEKALGRGEK